MVCLLKVPKIWCILLSVMVSAMTWMCLDPILEPHLRQVGSLLLIHYTNIRMNSAKKMFLFIAQIYHDDSSSFETYIIQCTYYNNN